MQQEFSEESKRASRKNIKLFQEVRRCQESPKTSENYVFFSVLCLRQVENRLAKAGLEPAIRNEGLKVAFGLFEVS